MLWSRDKADRLSSDPHQTEAWARTALQLKKDGYNASVVARKMITEHGMPEPAAEALVSDLFGKPVSARAGDTMVPIVVGLLMIAGGGLGLALFWFADLSFDDGEGDAGWNFCAVALIAGGIGKVFFAMVNRNAKEDLNERPRDDDRDYD